MNYPQCGINFFSTMQVDDLQISHHISVKPCVCVAKLCASVREWKPYPKGKAS